jgi:hypothetical protein
VPSLASAASTAVTGAATSCAAPFIASAGATLDFASAGVATIGVASVSACHADGYDVVSCVPSESGILKCVCKRLLHETFEVETR